MADGQNHNGDLQQRMRRLETLLAEVEEGGDPATQGRMREIVQSLMDYHGAALAAIVEKIAHGPPPVRGLLDELAGDELIASVLLLYGLHPEDVETRIGRALESVRPYLKSHGGNVELLGVEEGVVRLRLEGSCHGCPSSAITMKSAVETAIYEKAPEVTAIEVDGAIELATGSAAVFAGDERSHFALPILK
jgi:Fe-S cluster biogenesis protein NfuA